MPADELDLLRAELADVRRARQQAQRRAVERSVLERSIALAERDRSALSSPQIQQLRETAQTILDELVGSWADTDQLRWMLATLRRRAPHVLREPATSTFDRLLDEEAQARSDFAAAAERAGLPITVPAPTATR